MNAFTRAAAALVADPNMGTEVVFQPKDSPRVTCRGVFSRPVGEFGNRVTAGLMLSVPAASLPRLPVKGDEVVLTAPLTLAGATLRAGLTLRVERATAEESMAMFDIVLAVP